MNTPWIKWNKIYRIIEIYRIQFNINKFCYNLCEDYFVNVKNCLTFLTDFYVRSVLNEIEVQPKC